ncbi:MAG: hypothetical protein AB7P97_20415 [Hyphomonadaceae bacterium]
MDPALLQIGELLQGGGNVALLVAVYFIYKASHRLARVEKLLEILAARSDPQAVKSLPEVNGA